MALAIATLRLHDTKTKNGSRKGLALVIRIVANIGVAIAVCLLLFLAVGPRIAGYRTETMLTGSMVPYINPGDVIVVSPESISQVKVGQVLTYQAPLADHRIVSHRVIQVTRARDGAVLIRTKGDANPLPDPWVAQLQGSTAWRLQTVVPHLGDLIRALHSRIIRVISVWAIPATLLLTVLTHIWRKPSPAGD